jgi:hypothetical protein
MTSTTNSSRTSIRTTIWTIRPRRRRRDRPVRLDGRAVGRRRVPGVAGCAGRPRRVHRRDVRFVRPTADRDQSVPGRDLVGGQRRRREERPALSRWRSGPLRLGGLRVCVIDGNRGQDDVRKYLRVAPGEAPRRLRRGCHRTTPTRAFVDPGANVERRPGTRRWRSSVSASRLAHHARRPGRSDAWCPTRAYADVVAAAREFADLVVIDTQIAESVRHLGTVRRALHPAA